MSELLDQPLPVNIDKDGTLMHYLALTASTAEEIEKQGLLDDIDGFANVVPGELRELGMKLLESRNIRSAYELLAQSTANGKSNYYDSIFGPQHTDAYTAMSKYVPIIERKISGGIKMGLDLAAGTGESTVALAQTCPCVVAVDVVKPLLDIAANKLEKMKDEGAIGFYQTLEMDAVNLDLPPQSFDIITLNGLQPYLSRTDTIKMFNNISNVLKPGGRIYEIRSLNRTDPYSRSERALLVGVVYNIVMRLTYNDQHHNDISKPILNIEDFGFRLRTQEITGYKSGVKVIQLVKV